MTNKSSRRWFLLGTAAAVMAPAIARACGTTKQSSCGVPVPNLDFGKGTDTTPPDFKVELPLPDDIWRMIQPHDGTPAQWVLRLISFNQSGHVIWHIAQTVVGKRSVELWVHKGTRAFVYVTCRYTGWLTTGPMLHAGEQSFQRINWNMNYKWLDSHFPPVNA